MSIDFEKWFSAINVSTTDFPMDFLARLDGEYCNPAARAMYDMYLRIKELEAAQRWIPVTDLPKKYTQVICHDGEKVFMATVAQDDNWWFAGKMVRVIGWMPKPELPQE